MSETKKQKQFYLKIPYEILNLPGLDLCEKVLLAHIYSFGAKGCWQSNKTLAEIFMTSERSISRWLVAIKAFLLVKNPKGYYRTVWARSHPEVTSSGHAAWDNTDKPYPVHSAKNGRHVSQKRSSESAKNGFRHGQICPTTINNTIIENNKRTIASPPPLPAGGQAPATLQVRRRQFTQEIERLKSGFGKTERETRLSPEQFEQRRQSILKGLTVAAKPQSAHLTRERLLLDHT